MSQRFEDVLSQFIKLHVKDIVVIGDVESVDKETGTCSVMPLNSKLAIPKVRMTATRANLGDFAVIPKVGSSVLISRIGMTNEQWCVLHYSDVDEVLFHGGENGGLIKINELVSELNKTKAVVDAIAVSLNSWVIPPSPDAGLALKTLVTANLTGKTSGNYANLENEKVKH